MASGTQGKLLIVFSCRSVSYTHLDVYKRQLLVQSNVYLSNTAAQERERETYGDFIAFIDTYESLNNDLTK